MIVRILFHNSPVFKVKVKAIIDDIYRQGIFGCALTYIYTVEFQKHSLPHIHLLVVLQVSYSQC